MITVSGTIFSVEPEDVEVPATIDGVETTVAIRGTGIQVTTQSGHTVKIATKTHVDMARGEFAPGDVVALTLTKG